jgi:hypothetical protein
MRPIWIAEWHSVTTQPYLLREGGSPHVSSPAYWLITSGCTDMLQWQAIPRLQHSAL